MRTILRIASLATVLATTAAAGPNDAHADEEGALAWGLLAGELSMAGVFALNFGVHDWPSDGPAFALNFMPMVLGPGAGVAAHFLDLDPRPAYAVHGGGLVGLDLFMLGMLIDGRAEDDRLRVGATAWTLGAIGAAAGVYLGATEIDNSHEGSIFYGAPLGGFAVGGLVIGSIAALAAKDTDHAFQRVVMGATGGLSVGLLASFLYAHSDPKGPRTTARTATPIIRANPEAVTFSFGGSF